MSRAEPSGRVVEKSGMSPPRISHAWSMETLSYMNSRGLVSSASASTSRTAAIFSSSSRSSRPATSTSSAESSSERSAQDSSAPAKLPTDSRSTGETSSSQAAAPAATMSAT